MKLILKTLKQEQFEIHAELEDTVEVLKKKIEEKYSHPVSHQKLIFAGKVLEDGKTLAQYSLKEGAFMVLMVRAVSYFHEPFLLFS